MNYTSAFAVVAPVGLWSTRLRCPQIHRLNLFVTRWLSTRDAQRNQNSEPKLRPPAVSKSLTRSTARLAQLEDGNDRAILVQGDEGSAQVVRLGHSGTPSLDAATKLPF